MNPSHVSLGTGLLLGAVGTIVFMGYLAAPDRCSIVSEVYQSAHDRRPPLRGSSEDGLNLAESFAIGAANTVSSALGVSCFIEGQRHAG